MFEVMFVSQREVRRESSKRCLSGSCGKVPTSRGLLNSGGVSRWSGSERDKGPAGTY